MYYPCSTYRVQLNSSFTFAHLRALLPYLHELGVSTIYASPVTRAHPGSNHGYDVTDPLEINPEIGTLEQFREIAAQLKNMGMSWLQDIVPNHMAFSAENTRLMDVLERGPYSPYYTYFDITWQPQNSRWQGKVMLPVLGSDQKECLQRSELQLRWDSQGPGLFYFDQRFPLSLDSLQYLFPGLALAGEMEEQYKNASLKEWQAYYRQWVHFIEADPVLLQDLQHTMEAANNDSKAMQEVIDRQWYMPECWKESDTGMNYRRFFAVNSLISVRMEEEHVFNDYHGLIAYLYHEGLIQGVRIDHIDGLYDPQAYIQRLRRLLGPDCYIIAEKILEYSEQLPDSWPLQGTSGYEFLSFVNQVLTNKEGGEEIRQFYTNLVPGMHAYQQIVFERKYAFLQAHLKGEWEGLVYYLSQLHLLPAVYDKEKLTKALGVWMAAFPVYRIYPQRLPLDETSLKVVQRAFDTAVLHEPSCWEELIMLRTLFDAGSDTALHERKLQFISRLMQFTGPLAAKGVEDTTFYVYNPLISHNEVGDSPMQLGITVPEFHEKMLLRRQVTPYSLNSSSTHDTKRGEDARLRINVLSEYVEEWKSLVLQWGSDNASFITATAQGNAPSVNDEYFIYQSLIGSYPPYSQADDSFKERAAAFIIKALRESNTYTTYTAPDEAYESACVRFIQGIITHRPFTDSFIPFLQKIAAGAAIYSLVQVVLKATAPGIPDIYQGCELWDTSFVDPDNRRPVDYELRQHLLQQLNSQSTQDAAGLVQWLAAHRYTGMEKLFVTNRILLYRANHHSLFLEGDYIPLALTDTKARAIAYARRLNNEWALVVVPVAVSYTMEYSDITVVLPTDAPRQWRDVFTGQVMQVAGDGLAAGHLLDVFPVAVLEPVWTVE